MGALSLSDSPVRDDFIELLTVEEHEVAVLQGVVPALSWEVATQIMDYLGTPLHTVVIFQSHTPMAKVISHFADHWDTDRGGLVRLKGLLVAWTDWGRDHVIRGEDNGGTDEEGE